MPCIYYLRLGSQRENSLSTNEKLTLESVLNLFLFNASSKQKVPNTLLFSIHIKRFSSTFSAQRNASQSFPNPTTKALVYLETEILYLFCLRERDSENSTSQHKILFLVQIPLYSNWNERKDTEYPIAHCSTIYNN